MPHLRSFRLGWQNQNLARFILYKFCFLAEPVQTADDIGIDFFCTLFEAQWNKTNTDLIPKSSFAIQVKSEGGSKKIDLTGYLPYLENLELPFFIGIVDPNTLTMTVFSGEYLIPFFVYKGLPEHLEAELCEESRIIELTDSMGWQTEISSSNYTVLFPRVAKIAATTDEAQLAPEVSRIQEICSIVRDNIAARINKQFILKGRAPFDLLLFAGPESLQYFEVKLLDSLTEAFFNLDWACSLEELKPQMERYFRLYENIYFQLTSFYGKGDLQGLLKSKLDLLKVTYEGAKRRIDSLQNQNEI